jgi:hypothetical protein
VRPRVWRPPVEPTSKERAVIERVKRAKLFVFLRKHRHEIFDEEFQEELGTTIYRQSALGQSPHTTGATRAGHHLADVYGPL